LSSFQSRMSVRGLMSVMVRVPLAGVGEIGNQLLNAYVG